MFLQPKRFKYKKIKKGKLNKLKLKSYLLIFGTIGLKACESGIITAKQLEAAQQIIFKKLKKIGKIWVRAFPNLPIFKKPVETRMGKGKGNFSHWGKKVKKGTVIFELCGITLNNAIVIFKTAASKFPVKTIVFK